MFNAQPTRREVISIHALRGEGNRAHHPTQGRAAISIHALRGEGNGCRACPVPGAAISIHALRGEGNAIRGSDIKNSVRFQSTPSAGRATRREPLQQGLNAISIHALRGEGNYPARPLYRGDCISIHALRGEGNGETTRCARTRCHFNPRPPRGGQLMDTIRMTQRSPDFNPRPPRGGQPDITSTPLLYNTISIHALRGEGNSRNYCFGYITGYFNPRPPRGGQLCDQIAVRH